MAGAEDFPRRLQHSPEAAPGIGARFRFRCVPRQALETQRNILIHPHQRNGGRKYFVADGHLRRISRHQVELEQFGM